APTCRRGLLACRAEARPQRQHHRPPSKLRQTESRAPAAANRKTAPARPPVSGRAARSSRTPDLSGTRPRTAAKAFPHRPAWRGAGSMLSATARSVRRSYAFRQSDRDPAARLDGFAQKPIAGRHFRTMFESGVAMGDLVGAKLRNRPLHFEIAVELLHLFGIMLVDHFFHRGGTRHRRFLAHESSGRAQRKSRHAPYRLQRGGPHAPFVYELVERLEMFLFLFRHVRDCLGRTARFGSRAHHRKLTFIDAHRAIFARMIDADHRVGVTFDLRTGRRRAGPSCCAHPLCLTNAIAPSNAAPSEITALYPAIEIPRSRQAAMSHITTRSLKSMVPVYSKRGPVQCCGPFHKCHSMPA